MLLRHLDRGESRRRRIRFPVAARASAVAAREARIDAVHPQLVGEFSEVAGIGRGVRRPSGSGAAPRSWRWKILGALRPGRGQERLQSCCPARWLSRGGGVLWGGLVDLNWEALAVECELAASP